MITCKTLREAQAVERVVRCHIEHNGTVTAYQIGDKLPHPPVDPNQGIKDEIAELEAQVTPRMLREAALGIDRTRLLAVEQKIAEWRKKL